MNQQAPSPTETIEYFDNLYKTLKTIVCEKIKSIENLQGLTLNTLIPDSDSWNQHGTPNAQITGINSDGNLLGESSEGHTTIFILKNLEYTDLIEIYRSLASQVS